MSSPSELLRPRALRANLPPVTRWKDAPVPHSYGIYADRLATSVTSTHAGTAVSTDVRILPSPLVPELQKDVSSRFGRRLRQLRTERELTQSDMARRFGIDRSFISDVERGRKSISLPMLEVLALGLDLSLSELFRDL